jgi:hypothetical protein
LNVEEPYKDYEVIPDELNALGKEIVDAAYKVHKSLGRVY